jgi:transposase-like protein
MSKKRRRLSAQFKAQVGLDASKGVEPAHAIAAKHGVHPCRSADGRRSRQRRLSLPIGDNYFSPPCAE